MGREAAESPEDARGGRGRGGRAGVTCGPHPKDRAVARSRPLLPTPAHFRAAPGLRPSALVVALLAFALSGCLPSCRKGEDRALVPSDSLSRRVSGETAEDTLALVWARGVAEIDGLVHPRTVRFAPDGTLWFSDAGADRIVALDPDGRPLGRVNGFDAPYLAGFRGDTVAVFSAGANRFDLVARRPDGPWRIARRVPVTGLPGDRTIVRYAHAWGAGYALKAGSADTPPFLLDLDADGRVRGRLALPGPYWRHAGLLRTRGADTLLSLSGFRPVVDWITHTPAPARARFRRDTLALVGFDSPMLARSRRFLAGDVAEAPLLTPTAAPAADGRLFVLNLRLGWLQVDVYSPAGQLERRLIQPSPAPDAKFQPEDLDVRADGAGGYRIAVAYAKPIARVVVYRWGGQ